MATQTDEPADVKRDAGPASAASASHGGAQPPEASGEQATQRPAAGDFARHLAELVEYASFYIAAKIDSVRLTVRSIVIYAVLGVVALLAAVSAVVTAVVLALLGVAGAIGAALHHAWLGTLIVGVGFLALLVLGVVVALPRVLKASRVKTVEKYESRKHNQHERFGRHI